ncbi:hypothetical protein CR513_21871, partial [Mucuna pruriens]
MKRVKKCMEEGGGKFQMPLHYPRYTLFDYQTMAEWRLDCLLKEYGLPIFGDLQQKRNFAIETRKKILPDLS